MEASKHDQRYLAPLGQMVVILICEVGHRRERSRANLQQIFIAVNDKSMGFITRITVLEDWFYHHAIKSGFAGGSGPQHIAGGQIFIDMADVHT